MKFNWSVVMVIGIDKGVRSKKYVTAAKNMNVEYKLIDCTANHAIEQIREVDALIWHWTQDRHADKRAAYSIIKSAELMGKQVYPSSNTCWMFDDKVYEKYLLESVGAPVVETYVFFDKKSAMKWLRKQTYPVVYKLSGGAGSSNVRLIKNEKEAERICSQHFSFWGRPDLAMKLYYTDYNQYLKTVQEFCWGDLYRYGNNNRGYLLFQRFVPDNTYDIRVTIIGSRGVIFRRLVRDHDFRASGSGKIVYEVSAEDIKAIPIAREITKKIGSQTMTFDFIYDRGQLKIVEMGYGFTPISVYNTPGWYDEQMEFHEGRTDVHRLVIENLLEACEDRDEKLYLLQGDKRISS